MYSVARAFALALLLSGGSSAASPPFLGAGSAVPAAERAKAAWVQPCGTHLQLACTVPGPSVIMRVGPTSPVL